MKIIYLFDENWNKAAFQFNEISELTEELTKRGVRMGKASIGDEASIFRTLFITGSKHAVNWYGTGIVHIGCHRKTIQEWLDIYEPAKEGEDELASSEGYGSALVEEYYGYMMIL